MRQAKILVFIFFITFQIFAQVKISVPREVRRIDTEFSIDKLYNKITGERITEKEFEKLVKNNPNLPLERIYDNRGNIIKYLFDPAEANSKVTYTKAKDKTKIGEIFPELIFKTVDGETIKLKYLKGKMVILRFELEADTFRFKKDEIEKLDEAINQTQRKSEIEAIIIFDSTNEQIKKGFDLENSNFKLIPNGSNFHNKLNIRDFPSTIILDKVGRLLKEFDWSDSIDVLEMLNKS